MKLAIVGTSTNLTEIEELRIRLYLKEVLTHCNINDIIISGGAYGVDSIAKEVAEYFHMRTEIYNPEGPGWEEFTKRNLKIAEACDELILIFVSVHSRHCYHHTDPQAHEKTAGCWTLNEALKLGKKCTLFIARGTN